jgi:hexosaminidase
MMMKRVFFLLCLFGFNNLDAVYSQGISVIPQPLSMQELPGKFKINNLTKITYDTGNSDLKSVGLQFSDQVKKLTGYALKVLPAAGNAGSNVIVLTTKNAVDSLGDEGYTLVANETSVRISGKKANGVFYGAQTLYQLLPVKGKSYAFVKAPLIPAVKIADKPRFGWRGMMLDVGRYFYSVEFVKKYIDYLALHKLNVFHWHLTEDHGWRIEIKKHPRLTAIGAWRNGTQFANSQIDNTPHGGFYTQDQIRDIVAYAAKRYVTVVPEIEMPGHATAALVAYPNVSCTGGPFKMLIGWGIQKEVFCAGKEETFNLLEDVLTEVVALFPGKFIHIGGDECPKDRWKVCLDCKARMKKENLKDEHELQSYFIRRIEKFLTTKNKSIIGWDEILEGGLAPNAAVMSWRGTEGGIAAARQAHDVVMTPYDFLYLDYYQGEPYLEPKAIGGNLQLEKVYNYEPVPAVLTAEEAKYIKGVQGNVWAEFIHSPEKVEYMAFPRAAAMAELAWTIPARKNWTDFSRRIEKQYQRYDDLGINYAKSAYNVWHTVSVDSLGNKATVAFKTNSYQPQIRYSLDGSAPTVHSLVYRKPFDVKLPVTIKAATFKEGRRMGAISSRSIFIDQNKQGK